MASSNVKKRSRSKKGTDAPLVPHQRKKEIFGLILMVLALLLSLALVSYDAADDTVARAFSLEAAFDPGDNRAENALGLVGAALAWLLVPNFLGYNVLLLTGLLFAWGYVVFRHRTGVFLPFLSVLTLVGTFILACLFGWFAIVTESSLGLWSGTVGMGTAGWMQRVFGTVGSFVLLMALLAIAGLLTVDRDIQRSLDRLEEFVAALRDRVLAWWGGLQERRAERRAERAALLEERRAGRETQRATQREAAAEESPRSKPASPAPRDDRASGDGASRPVAPPSGGRTINDTFRTAEPEPRPETRSEKPAPEPPPARPTPPPQPKPRPLPSASGTPAGDGSVELKVRERVEEEKAETIERTADVPAEDKELQYQFPPIDLLAEADADAAKIDYNELEENKRVLLDKLDTYNIEITEINAVVGPTVTLYELTPAPGVKISRITSLEDDLAMAMAARGIRMIAPIPGKSAIGVEIPNRNRELVPIRDLLATARFRDSKMELPIPIGKTIEGEVFMQDLTKMPHLLIAGATGSGKSVGINTIVTGLLYACHPANLKFVMIDPKKIELQQYKAMVDHYIAMPDNSEDPIITDFSEALGVLKSCEKEMERRYDMLSKASVRGIRDYNRKLTEGKLPPEEGHHHLPYIVVIVDELADLMMTAGKEIEGPIARLAQMARAVGIHLILATQRPSVDVITGLIKANFPARIAYQVASKVDSRTIMDQNGAEQLVGNGDLLYMMGSQVVRLQGPFISVDEVDDLMEAVSDQRGRGPYILPPAEMGEDGVDEILGVEEADDLFEEAARIIVRSQQGSVSLLQRKLSVGYTRAARIVDQLEEAGIVGPFVGSKARDVLVESEIQLDELLKKSKEQAEQEDAE